MHLKTSITIRLGTGESLVGGCGGGKDTFVGRGEGGGAPVEKHNS